jgi:hypothetical protein
MYCRQPGQKPRASAQATEQDFGVLSNLRERRTWRKFRCHGKDPFVRRSFDTFSRSWKEE